MTFAVSKLHDFEIYDATFLHSYNYELIAVYMTFKKSFKRVNFGANHSSVPSKESPVV